MLNYKTFIVILIMTYAIPVIKAPTDTNKIIWEGEAVVIDEAAKNEDE